MRKAHRSKNSRKLSLDQKIKNALDKKPTASQLMRKGLTVEEAKRTVSDESPKTKRRKIGSRANRIKANKRPASVARRVALKPYNKPNAKLLAMPVWFNGTSKDIDVSIIVPLYKSREVIREQIASWDLEDDGLKKEII